MMSSSAQANGGPEDGGDVVDGAVGKLFGDVTTHRFQFIVTDPTITATSYVSFEHDEERFLSQVTTVEREVVRTGDQEGDQLVGTAKIIGRRNNRGRLELPSTPPRPGIPVLHAQPGLVRSALNLDDRGAYLGLLRGLDLPVHLDMNALVQKHCSILAKTGAGKSYALGVLMEELLKHEVPIVVIDPHGEHASLAAPNSAEHELPLMKRFKVRPKSFADRVVEYAMDTDAVPEALPFRLDGRELSAREIAELLEGGLTAAQTGVLHQSVRELKEVGSYALDDIIESVEQQSGSSKWPVLHALEDLRDLGLLSNDPTPITALVEAQQATILNLKGLAPHVQQLVVARVASDLFEARKVGLIAPHLFVLEEAHNYCPERHLTKAMSGEIIRQVASEGRKFGMGLAVVSQRPAKVDKNVLSQCNTQIILKVTNANDLKAISSSVEGLPPGIEDEIQALQVGTALVSEPSIAVPLFCEIRPRMTRHGGSSIQVVRDRSPPASTAPREPEGGQPPEGEDDDLDGDPPSGAPEPVATPARMEQEDPRFQEIELAEEALGTAPLEELAPGVLEGLLVETESLLGALDEMGLDGDVDRARLAGMRSNLRAHQHRLRKLLDGRA